MLSKWKVPPTPSLFFMMAPSLIGNNQPFYADLIFAKGMVVSGVAQRFDLFILTCLGIVFYDASQSVESLWASDQPVAETSTWQHTTLATDRQTSMLPVGFEPTISAGERPKTYALDRAATGISQTKGKEKFCTAPCCYITPYRKVSFKICFDI